MCGLRTALDKDQLSNYRSISNLSLLYPTSLKFERIFHAFQTQNTPLPQILPTVDPSPPTALHSRKISVKRFFNLLTIGYCVASQCFIGTVRPNIINNQGRI